MNRTALGDRIFHILCQLAAVLVLVTIGGFFLQLAFHSRLSLEKFGWRFLVSSEWNPFSGEFGAASSIYGTLVSTAVALLIAIPLSFAIAFFLVELASPAVAAVASTAIELLAAIPSIIYGMWGLFVLAPIMAEKVQPALNGFLGFLPLFQGPPMGLGLLTAGLILALMILPFVSATMRDVFRMVPAVVKESAYGMGATRWEVARRVTLPYGLRGIAGACFLGLGRAVGETMAVTFVIGNDHTISSSLFHPGNSIASTLANEFTEAAEPLYLSSLMELGLILLCITFLIQVLANIGMAQMRKAEGTGN